VLKQVSNVEIHHNCCIRSLEKFPHLNPWSLAPSGRKKEQKWHGNMLREREAIEQREIVSL